MRGLLKPAIICESRTMCTRQHSDTIAIKIDTSQTIVNSCSEPSSQLASCESHVSKISMNTTGITFNSNVGVGRK